MAFVQPTETFTHKIETVTIGVGDKAVTLGGQNAFAFHKFEGEIPNSVKVAMEVYDNNPQNWVPSLKDSLGDVLSSPVDWAKKCEQEFGADLICLQLASTDPNGEDRSPDEAAKVVEEVLEAISIPLMVYGTDSPEKDKQVLEKVANLAQGKNIAIGPATEDNYKTVAAAAMGFKHVVVALTPCDVNLAKQLNILLTQMGLPKNKIIIDPSTGALGYGLDYTYTIIERLRLAALQQGDEMTAMPVLCNLGVEAWKSKESKVSNEQEPSWGESKTRAISWEIMTAFSLAVAGADLVIMRHPESVSKFREAVKHLGSGL
jgi:CO dehydrogenase/acetyl-CoA synthase delta subunit